MEKCPLLQTCSRQHCELKSKLMIGNFNYVKPQFQILGAFFPLVFTTHVIFCTQIVVLFLGSFLAAHLFSKPRKVGLRDQQ